MVALDYRKDIGEDDPIQESRPLLIFNHNPKAGGGSILAVLRGFKVREMTCGKWSAKAESSGSACKASVWEEAFSEEDGGVDTAFLHSREFSRTTHFDRVHGFVIGSIREPCDQYLSLWSWGSLGNGDFRRTKVSDPRLYGVSPPYFNTTSDKNRFLAWMKHPSVVGTVGDRVKKSYGESVLDTVDCWVFVEDFRDSLLRCLHMYADQGGFVDWEAPTVAALLEQRSETVEKSHHYRGAEKNDPLGDPRSSHHGNCEGMFDTEIAKQVEGKTDHFVYDLFGYEGCCNPGTNFHPRGSVHLDSAENLRPIDTTLSDKKWQSSIPTPQRLNDRSIDSMIAVATITGILLLTFYRFRRTMWRILSMISNQVDGFVVYSIS